MSLVGISFVDFLFKSTPKKSNGVKSEKRAGQTTDPAQSIYRSK